MVHSGLPSIPKFLSICLPSGLRRSGGQQRGFLISSRTHFSSGCPSGWDGVWMIAPFRSTPLFLRFIFIPTSSSSSFPCGGQRPGVSSPIGWTIPSPVPSVFTRPAHYPIPAWREFIEPIQQVPFSFIRLCLQFPIFLYFFFWVPCPNLLLLFPYLGPPGVPGYATLYSVPKSFTVASCFNGRGQGAQSFLQNVTPQFNASIYASANRAFIGPLFRVAGSGDASAAKPAILSPRSSIASLTS
ncbi:unnamed protein product [Acanthosepion pharaonis]|uniref:Uncharacterized protein n=1 Tax=Acanthosepion pharaonis TaxID=158019 RepID=A0A812DCE0_ACAPH|nr:unnamed protein product [Sepia pharaonis]